MNLRRSFPFILLVVGVAGIYYAAAELGLSMAFVAQQVTVVWPPTGVALAALILFGARLAPAIWLGAFCANIAAHASPLAALGIATGNTLEAVFSVFILRSVLQFRNSLTRVRDAVALILVGATFSTILSATIGVASLCFAGDQPWQLYSRMWWVWWLGDAVGALVIAPLLLVLATLFTRAKSPFYFHNNALPELGLLLCTLTTVSLLVFSQIPAAGTLTHPLEYTIFPFVIWAAIRFGQLGSSIVVFTAAALAIVGTLHGYGPFALGSTHEALTLLQVYMFVVSATGLLLGAAIEERATDERRRTAEFTVSRKLAEAGNLSEAASYVLGAICEQLGWDAGLLWTVDATSGVLRCVEFWRTPSLRADEFKKDCHSVTMRRGEGFPGRIWETGKPAAIVNLEHDANFSRALSAMRAGLKGAVGFPIELGNEIYGVMEFFSRDEFAHDTELLAQLETIARNIGQFMERTRTQEALHISEQRFRKSTETLLEMDQRKNEFLAILAHELRNPLAPIRNAVQVIRLLDQKNDDFYEALRIMERQLHHLVRLVDDLLDVSRINRGTIELRKNRVPIAQIIESAIETSRPIIHDGEHVLELSLPANPIWVEGDETRLSQVVSNLLNNAARYTDPGGKIRLEVSVNEHEVQIHVKDTGKGISPELLPKIFDIFMQADRKLNSAGGLGVGLTLVKRLVELHGGSVRAASAGAGAGSEFTVSLPLAPRLSSRTGGTAVESEPFPHPRPKGRRILVVDDNKDSADSLSMMLHQRGNEVRTVFDGFQALEAVQSFTPDVVLLDIGLPGMSGYEVARTLRTDPRLRRALLIAQTGWGQEEALYKAKEAGFDYHLVKPLDLSDLETIFAALDARL